MDEELRRELILENNAHPFNKKTIIDDSYIKVNSNNSSCIDNINLYIKIENDIITDFYFDGEACAITTSATSIMIQNILNKKINEALDFVKNYEQMINGEVYNSDLLKEANAYSEIYKQQNRKTCALLPYKGLKRAIEEYESNKS